MLTLARPGLWIAGACLLCVAIVVGSLLPGPLVAMPGISDKLEHAGAYFLLTSWLAGMVERGRYLGVAVAALLLGAGLEVAQGLLTTTREADLHDLAANAGGIGLSLVLAYLGLGGWAGRVERWLGLAPTR
jgi:VanZ family protein